jgi:hypothetical protein
VGKEIILALDISTSCIGASLLLNEPNKELTIIKISHVAPKLDKKIKGPETLFLKKQIFEEEFLSQYSNFGITDVVIEEPLISSNNSFTVSTLLRFNGMISDGIYNKLNIVPSYISSYDARKYAFPELMGIRKYNKKGEIYDKKTIISNLKNNNLTLFSDFQWDIDKKYILWNKVCEQYPNIEWIYNKKDELIKENFDMSDSVVCGLAYINKEKYGELNPIITTYEMNDPNTIEYEFKYWTDFTIKKQIILN